MKKFLMLAALVALASPASAGEDECTELVEKSRYITGLYENFTKTILATLKARQENVKCNYEYTYGKINPNILVKVTAKSNGTWCSNANAITEQQFLNKQFGERLEKYAKLEECIAKGY